MESSWMRAIDTLKRTQRDMEFAKKFSNTS
jgi:hypothetical protein